MPDYLALDWERHHLCGLVARISAGRVEVTQCVQFECPPHLDPATQPAEVGAWLRDQLAQSGIDSRPVLISLPREAAVVRQLELPQVPDEELPDVVRFQAATRSSTPMDRLLWDFLPLPDSGEGTGRDVLLATIPTETGERIRAVLGAAGLELESIGLSPVASAELVARAEQSRRDDLGQTSLVIAQHRQRVEISVLRGRHLLFAHSTLLSGEDDRHDVQAVLAEVSRSRVALERLHIELEIARAWVLGAAGEHRALVDALSERLDCEVRTLDPLVDTGIAAGRLEMPDDRAMLSGPAGALLSKAQATVDGIDFLHPRRAAPKTDRRKVRAMQAAAAVLLLGAGGFGAMQLKISNLETEISQLQQREGELKVLVDGGKPVVEAAGRVHAWDDRRIDWREPLDALVKLSGGTDTIYFTNVDFEPALGDAIGRVRATGYARQRHDVEQFSHQLVQQNLRVHPQPITTSRRDPNYPFRFELDVELLPQLADDHSTKKGQKS